MKLKDFLIVVIMFFYSCHQEEMLPEKRGDNEYISIENDVLLQAYKKQLIDDVEILANARSIFDQNLIEQANWTKVRRLRSEELGYTSYSMNVRLGNDATSYDFILFEYNGELYPFLLAFNPSMLWRSDVSFRMDNPLDGEIQLVSLKTGQIWVKKELDESSGHSESGRIESVGCYTVWVEVNKNYWINDGGTMTLVVVPASFFPLLFVKRQEEMDLEGVLLMVLMQKEVAVAIRTLIREIK